MPLTAAEKQKNYRERLKKDPVKRELALKKMRDHAQWRRDKGIDKKISDMSDREKRKQRREWRERQNKCRKEKKKADEQQKRLQLDSPPMNPQEDQVEESPASRGRKKVRRDRAKSYRKIIALEKKVAELTKKAEKYKKKYQRSMKSSKYTNKKEELTPRSKINQEAKTKKLCENVKRQLLFGNSVIEELRKKYESSNEEMKKKIANIFLKSELLKKYRLLTKAKLRLNINVHSVLEKRRKRCIQQQLRNEVEEFYCRDSISICTPGKKQTITRGKEKKQKRLLTQNVSEVRNLFVTETNKKISVATFARWRPFWVVRAKISDRDSCLCKQHDNLEMKLKALIKENVVKRASLHSLFAVCDTETKRCMYNECDACKDQKCISERSDDGDALKKIVEFQEWVRTTEEIEKDGKARVIKKTKKVKKETTVGELISLFNDEMKKKFCRHVFNIRHQYQQATKCKQELCYEEAAVHMDFSENYCCKLGKEVQSMHFGSSHEQATLHTLVVYYENGAKDTYCTVSNSRRHDAYAVWAHLDPILKILREKAVKVVHFFSDGPVTQYKNKDNCFLMQNYFHQLGFDHGTWNFSEASHGKGAPDGVGAAIKRISDNLVAKGTDIPTARALYEVVKDKTSVGMFFISEEDITNLNNKFVCDEIKKVNGIMKSHALVTTKPHHLQLKELSCFCKKLPISCSCFNMDHAIYEPVTPSELKTGRKPAAKKLTKKSVAAKIAVSKTMKKAPKTGVQSKSSVKSKPAAPSKAKKPAKASPKKKPKAPKSKKATTASKSKAKKMSPKKK